MSNTKPSNLVFAPTGGLIGAVVGGILWAKSFQWPGFPAGSVAFAIGLFTGLGVLFMGRSRAISVCSISSLFAIFGILFGTYLDVRWNALERIKTQLIDTYGISSNQAEPISSDHFRRSIYLGTYEESDGVGRFNLLRDCCLNRFLRGLQSSPSSVFFQI